jgi:hypothetical protein
VTGALAPNVAVNVVEPVVEYSDWLVSFVRFGQFLSALEEQLVSTFTDQTLVNIPVEDVTLISPPVSPVVFVCDCNFDIHLSDGRKYNYDVEDRDDLATYCVDMQLPAFLFYDGEDWLPVPKISILHFKSLSEDAYITLPA